MRFISRMLYFLKKIVFACFLFIVVNTAYSHFFITLFDVDKAKTIEKESLIISYSSKYGAGNFDSKVNSKNICKVIFALGYNINRNAFCTRVLIERCPRLLEAYDLRYTFRGKKKENGIAPYKWSFERYQSEVLEYNLQPLRAYNPLWIGSFSEYLSNNKVRSIGKAVSITRVPVHVGKRQKTKMHSNITDDYLVIGYVHLNHSDTARQHDKKVEEKDEILQACPKDYEEDYLKIWTLPLEHIIQLMGTTPNKQRFPYTKFFSPENT